MESSPRCATLPLPPPLPSSIPTKRLQTQMQEAPACVQNAMMTKDKKPFTYTPGGIDLSQIKSPRMARRIERNANCEGVTNVPKVSPLAEPNRTNLPPVVSSGMPVQVFPTGPPAPPPPPPKQLLNDTNKTTNGTQRTEKTPIKSFEPPPIGFRPEIKIPPNPMATLKPAPKPQEKNDFWVEEYKKERSKSPLIQKEDRNNETSNELTNTQKPLTPKTDNPTNNFSQTVEQRSNTPKRQWSPQRTSTPTVAPISPQLQCESPSSKSNARVESPFSSQQPNPYLPKPLSPIKLENSTKQVENHQKQPEEVLTRQQRELIHQQDVLDQIRRQQRWQQPPQNSVNQQQQQQQQQQQHHQLQQQQQQQQQQYQQYLQQQQQLQQQQKQQPQQFQQQQFKRPDTQPIQNANGGTHNNASPSHSEAFSLLTQETPQWMSKRGINKETPEWVDRDDSSANASKNVFLLQEQRPQQNAPKERIIPIQIERTPPVSSGGFDYPQAYYNNNNTNYAGSPVHNNPNHFVDQGYSNFAPSTPDDTSKFVKNAQQSSRGTRTVPIKIDGQISPFNVTVSDPLSQSPIVLQKCATLPLPPPLPSSIPTKRLQTQMQEAPACVQNAMMTKDKKPFTYTPGGIDLSQIKSPRMARRIERNANCEGVTNVPKVSPLAEPNRTNLPPVVSSGMPVQVFPTGPPAPPPPPPKQLLNDTNKTTNGTQRTEKTPIKSFEPPPIGFRPEIKIPPNPMATLKPAPKPQEKNDFWVEEYKKERSKSPLIQKEDRNNETSNELTNTQQPLTPKTDNPTNNFSQTVEQRSNTPKRQWSPQRTSTPTVAPISPQLQCESPSSKSNARVESPFSSQQPNPYLPKPLSPIKLENSTKQVENHQKQPEEVLTRQQRELIHQQDVLDQIRRQQRWQQPPQNSVNQQQQQQQQQQQHHQLQQQQQQQQQQYQQYLQQQQQLQQQQKQQPQQFQQQQFKRPDTQPIQNANGGTHNNASPSHSEAFSLLTQETPQWMSKRGINKETPEWVDRDDSSANASKNVFLLQEQRPQQNAPKKRIIPIQIERTPPVSSGGFDYPQAYYNNNNTNYAGSPVHNNPNHFVDQGYSNFAPSTPDDTSKFVKNAQQSSRGTRTVPIKIDGQISPFNVTVSDPLSQSPIVLQKSNGFRIEVSASTELLSFAASSLDCF